MDKKIPLLCIMNICLSWWCFTKRYHIFFMKMSFSFTKCFFKSSCLRPFWGHLTVTISLWKLLAWCCFIYKKPLKQYSNFCNQGAISVIWNIWSDWYRFYLETQYRPTVFTNSQQILLARQYCNTMPLIVIKILMTYGIEVLTNGW